MGDNNDDGVVRIGKRCYVGNLAWKTSWQDLKDKFRECGQVIYTNVMKDEEGRSKGWGIVEFETPEEALQAINTLNGAELGGRRILVREDREDRDVKNSTGQGQRSARGRGGSRGRSRGGRSSGRGVAAAAQSGESSGLQIVIQGIPWSYTWRELKDLFADIGDVERADIAQGADGRSRGFGTVKFTTADAATRAIQKMDRAELEGRTLAVFLDKYA